MLWLLVANKDVYIRKSVYLFAFADISFRKDRSRFSKILPKLVVLCSVPPEDEVPRAGYIMSRSSHPAATHFCEVCSFQVADEVCLACPVPST